MPAAYPLTCHLPDDTIAWSRHSTISTRQFLSEARALARLFPAHQHILNLCKNRYHFMVGLAASLISAKISLLPSSHTTESLRQMQALTPDLFCLTDESQPAGLPGEIPIIHYPAYFPRTDNISEYDIPHIIGDTIVAKVFTSGSTGSPMPHNKTWQSLVFSTQSAIKRRNVAHPLSIIGTVPPQHMYGLESTILLTWHGNGHLWMGDSFYPADIADALACAPAPGLLVTTPFHLKTLLDSLPHLAGIECLLCATAPLDAALAARAEHALHAPLYEIYGCTETGQLASRRPTQSTDWQVFDDIQITQNPLTTIASGGHLSAPTALPDRLDMLPDGLFRLQGRHHDLINIAGKRHSLSALTNQLLSIPQVHDGCFFMPDAEPNDSLTRLCAVVVATALSTQQILQALRLRIDPAFLPRPLIMAERLPRNATGKLPHQALMALLKQYRSGHTNDDTDTDTEGVTHVE